MDVPEVPRKRGRRGHYSKDSRSGRWGSFWFSMAKGATWEAFQVDCPLHTGTIEVIDSKGNVRCKKIKCCRFRQWKTPVETDEQKRDQREAILGLMQWCAVCGTPELGVESVGPGGKAGHKLYMPKEQTRRMLKTKEEIESMRVSHGLSDDEAYDPFVAVGAELGPDHEGEQDDSGAFRPPAVEDTEPGSPSD